MNSIAPITRVETWLTGAGQSADGWSSIKPFLFVRVTDAVGRTVSGEKQSGVHHFRDVIGAQAAHTLNPDISGVGGIIDMLEIAQIAALKDIQVSPHCWDSMTVSAAAMLHVCSAIPNAEIAEFFPGFVEFGSQFADVGHHIENGHARLSDRPGLGVVIDTEALQRFATHKMVEQDWRTNG